jgi:hypothetical protein
MEYDLVTSNQLSIWNLAKAKLECFYGIGPTGGKPRHAWDI